MYFDRAGQPMDFGQWAATFEGGDFESTKRVAKTDLVLDGVTVHVSTVWLGLHHNYGAGRPLIFETMVFGLKGPLEDYQERYATEAEAQAGHDRIVTALSTGRLDLLDR